MTIISLTERRWKEKIAKIKIMRAKLYEISERYSPVEGYLQSGDLKSWAAAYTRLYELWLSGKSITEKALKMEIAPDKEEAVELSERLQSPEAFIEEMQHTMATLVDCGVVERKA